VVQQLNTTDVEEDNTKWIPSIRTWGVGVLKFLKFLGLKLNKKMWSKLGSKSKAKVLKHRYPKQAHTFNFKLWARRIWLKERLGLKWQFDSQPLKHGKQGPNDFQLGHATWHWKDCNEKRNYRVITCLKTPILTELQGSKFFKHYMSWFWDSILGFPRILVISM
jgi:hypothetical protein